MISNASTPTGSGAAARKTPTRRPSPPQERAHARPEPPAPAGAPTLSENFWQVPGDHGGDKPRMPPRLPDLRYDAGSFPG